MKNDNDTFKINQIILKIFSSVGELTNRKKESLAKLLKFEQSIDRIINISFINSEDKENIIINPDGITYIKIGEYIDKVRVYSLLSSIIDLLMLEEKSFAIIDIQGLSDTKDSHNESIVAFNENFSNMLDKYPGVYGVGYRFLFKNKNINGEVKIEPFINDPTKYYYQLIGNINSDRQELNKIIEMVDIFSDDLNKNYSKLKELIAKR